MRPDQERVRNLLTDTVTLLCKNGLQFNKQLKVQGLLGITTDENDVFVVHINENFGEAIGSASITVHQADSPEHSESGVVDLTERDRIRRKPHHVSRRKRRSRDSDSSPRLGSPSHVPPSPTISNSETESAHFRIKKEENSAPGGCREKDRSRKLYPSSGDDRDAMRETYSGLSLSDIQSGFEFEAIAGGGLEGTNGSTGPPSKRRTLPPVAASTSRPPDHADSPSAGPFITGIARHSEKTGSSSDTVANVSSWDNSALDELSQMTGDGSLDDTPGCSTWGPSQAAGEVPGLPQGPDDSVHGYSVWASADLGLHRRSRVAPNKPFICGIDGCASTFFRRSECYRHQRIKHGRKHVRGHSLQDPLGNNPPGDNSPDLQNG